MYCHGVTKYLFLLIELNYTYIHLYCKKKTIVNRKYIYFMFTKIYFDKVEFRQRDMLKFRVMVVMMQFYVGYIVLLLLYLYPGLYN